MRFVADRPERVLTVIHEELVREPEAVFRKVFARLEVPPETGPLEFFRSCRLNSSFPKSPTGLPATENLSKPFQQWTLAAGGHFVDLTPYKESEPWWQWPRDRRAIFLEEAGAAMIEHGFASAAELERWRTSEPEQPCQVASAGSTDCAPAEPAMERIRRTARQLIPKGAAVLIASKDPAESFALDGCHTFRFPRVYLPADSNQAIAHLETLRGMGAGFLLFPSTEFWWFDRFPEFRLHLETKHQRLWTDEACVIYGLTSPLEKSP